MKQMRWVGSSKRDLRDMPKGARAVFGHELGEVAAGETPASAKVLKGFGGADVLELRADAEDGTFRAVYTVRLEGVVYVLHCFQKKSTKGIATSKQDVELIKARLKDAELLAKEV